MKKLMMAAIALMLTGGVIMAQGTPAKQDAKPKKETEKTTQTKKEKTTTTDKTAKPATTAKTAKPATKTETPTKSKKG